MMNSPNRPFAVANLTQLATDLTRALDGYGHGPVTPDAINDRGPTPVTIREALVALRERIDAFWPSSRYHREALALDRPPAPLESPAYHG